MSNLTLVCGFTIIQNLGKEVSDTSFRYRGCFERESLKIANVLTTRELKQILTDIDIDGTEKNKSTLSNICPIIFM